jgi:hypothetical protein
MKPQTPEPPIYGLLARFRKPEDLVRAVINTREKGFLKIDAYTPFPVHGLAAALGIKKNFVPLVTLISGIAGGALGFFMQWYSFVVGYPMNVGGRPPNSWPMFIPVTFELTILFAALAAFFSMLVANRLPQPYHPVFHVAEFERASTDGFFLCIQADDLLFKPSQTRRFLESLLPQAIYEVPQ